MWRTDIIKWDKISIETAKLYVELAEKRLDETVETAKNISDKNDKLLTLTVTLIIAISTYSASTNFLTNSENILQNGLAIILVILFITLWFLFINFISVKIGTKGEEPKIILMNKFIDEYNDSEQYLNLAIHICEVYQEKINNNHPNNLKRDKRLRKVIYLYVFLSIFSLLVLVYQKGYVLL